MKFTLTKPCKDCPFVRAVQFPLARRRVSEILHGIIDQQKNFRLPQDR